MNLDSIFESLSIPSDRCDVRTSQQTEQKKTKSPTYSPMQFEEESLQEGRTSWLSSVESQGESIRQDSMTSVPSVQITREPELDGIKPPQARRRKGKSSTYKDASLFRSEGVPERLKSPQAPAKSQPDARSRRSSVPSKLQRLEIRKPSKLSFASSSRPNSALPPHPPSRQSVASFGSDGELFDTNDSDNEESKEAMRRYVLSRRVFQLARKFYWMYRQGEALREPRLRYALKAVFRSSRTIMTLDTFLKLWYQHQLDLQFEQEGERRRDMEKQWEQMNEWLASVSENVSEGLHDRIDHVLEAIGTEFSGLHEKSSELSHECTVLGKELKSLMNHSAATLAAADDLSAEISETTAQVKMMLGDFLGKVAAVKAMISEYDNHLVDGNGRGIAEPQSPKPLPIKEADVWMKELENIMHFVEDSMELQESPRSLAYADEPIDADEQHNLREVARQNSCGDFKQVTFDSEAPPNTDAGKVIESRSSSSSFSSSSRSSSDHVDEDTERAALARAHLTLRKPPTPHAELSFGLDFDERLFPAPRVGRQPRKRLTYHNTESWEDANLREAVLHMRQRTLSPGVPRSPTVASMLASPSPLHPLYHSEPSKLPPIASARSYRNAAKGTFLRPHSLSMKSSIAMLSLQTPMVLPPIHRPRKNPIASPLAVRSGRCLRRNHPTFSKSGMRFQAVGSSCLSPMFRIFDL